jgi:hypothetical protein
MSNLFERCAIRLLQTLPFRISSRIHVDTATGCWEWTGAWTTGNGYGKIKWLRKNRVVHRVVYGLLVCHDTSLNYDIHLDHMCRNRICCNPNHLEPVTPKENTRRGCAVLFCKGKP